MSVGVVVQLVKTEWSGESQSGPGEARRSAAPVGFELPHLRPAVHEIWLKEPDFEPVWRTRSPRHNQTEIGLREEDELLSVHLMDTMHAKPRRFNRPSPVLLMRGEWVRWQLNHRWPRPRDGGQNYLLTTLNVLYGTPEDAKVFLGTPTRYVDERTVLR